MSFEKQFEDSIESFNLYVKDELETLLNTEIISIEEDSGSLSDVTKTLDTKASSDLILKYSTDSCIYFAANRILNSNSENIEKFPISITLRNSINQDYDVTEINKLKNSYDNLIKNIPSVMPKNICVSRVLNLESGIKALYDLIVIETVPLIEFIFSNKGLNICLMRDKFNNKDTIYFDKKDKLKAGLRANSDGRTTFLFFNKSLLDEFNIPYIYIYIKIDDEDLKENIVKKSKIIFQSRKDNEYQINEMKNFVYELEFKGLSSHLKEIFYDSTDGCCSFILSDNTEEEDISSIESTLCKIAQKHIGQFFFSDMIVHHGNPLLEMDVQMAEENEI